MKKPKELEKIIKGISNHRRLQILVLLNENPELALFEIASHLHANFKTVAEHTRRLVIAGLVWKRNVGQSVRHVLSPMGKVILMFLRTLE